MVLNIWNHDGRYDNRLVIVVMNNYTTKIGLWSESSFIITLTKGATIRRWGTTKGIGEIQTGGPTKSTVLDHTPESSFHEDKIQSIFPVSAKAEASWRKALKIS